MRMIKAGDTFPLNSGGSVTVIEYVSNKNVLIEHNDQHKHRAKVRADNLRLGKVRNPYQPSVYERGYLGVGGFKGTNKGALTPEYAAWLRMMQRAYCNKFHARNPTYRDCKVDSDWHNFQTFAAWFTSHDYYGLGYHLDKDLLVRGNKVYSSENCTLVPKDINNLLVDRAAMRGEFPIGVCFSRQISKFVASFNMGKKSVHIGTFDCPNKAHEAYVAAKETYVKEKALEWKDRIAPQVFDALMTWTVEEAAADDC